VRSTERSGTERKGAAAFHIPQPADAPLPIEVLPPPVATARSRRRPGRPRRPLFGAEAGPRARLFRKGPAELTETELLALLFGTGSRGFPAPTLAESLLTSRGLGGLAAASWQDLCAERGIGPVRAAQVLAGFELGRRCFRGEESREFIRGPEDIYTATADLREARKEHFLTFYLNARHQVITRETVSIGSLNASIVHPREVFEPAVRQSAAALILVHNHPSGETDPSDDDLALTRRLVQVGELLGIPVVDHIIVGRRGFTSLKQQSYF
jgi:DNA repair protein RadC